MITPSIRQLESSGIWFYMTDIQEFIEAHLPDINPDTYSTEKNRLLRMNTLPAGFFSEEEIEIINTFRTLKKQIERLCGWYSVKSLFAGRHQGLKGSEIKIEYEEHGAPYLAISPETCISVSHSGNYAICCLYDQKGKKIGLDLEFTENKDMSYILTVAFSDREQALPENKTWQGVFKNWTLKEAYLKYIREGFHESLKRVEILDHTIFHNGISLDHLHLYTGILSDSYRLSAIYD